MASNKMSLSWHEECLANFRRSNSTERASLERQLATLARSEQEAGFYATQIETARQRGLADFDRDRFLKPRSARVA